MAFAQALFNAMSAEFKVFTLVRPIQGQITPIQLKAHVEAGKESQAAIADMGNIVRRLSGSTLAQTIHAALLAFARANSVGGPEYSRGLSALSRLQRNSASPDLAAFFLFYVYRRSRDYRQAIRIGQALEKRQPNSSLVKTALGSCYFYMHDFNRAEQFYRQALALAPQDPSVRLELARVLEHRGDIAGARQLATQAAAADREGHLASFVKEFNQVLETRELHQQFRGD
jgi:Flp pilus assembly protein TadD